MADAAMHATRHGHEPDTLSLRALAIGAAAVATMVALAIGAALLVVKAGPRAEAAGPPPRATNPPGLQPAPATDIEAYRREKHALLSGYAWVDRAHGIVRIPIEDAMSLLASGRPQPGARR